MSRKKKDTNYFNSDTETGIIEYLNESSPYKRELIYKNKLKYSFEKLAEYIINTYKFPYLNETLKNKKVEVVSHIVQNLSKFNPEKGKAFSYFSKAAKMYLILKNTNAYNELKTQYQLESTDSDDADSVNLLDTIPDTSTTEVEFDTSDFIKELIHFFDKNIPHIFDRDVDKKIAYAIIQIMSNYKNIETFNKKALYLMLKDMVNVNATSITRIFNKMKSMYPNLIREYNLSGTLKYYDYDNRNDWIR
ncbi:MAG TPA: hypothetical protein PLY35_08965 [Thermotogota bacterium]|nr:hypothetical protein [Thermotogota bacterium]